MVATTNIGHDHQRQFAIVHENSNTSYYRSKRLDIMRSIKDVPRSTIRPTCLKRFLLLNYLLLSTVTFLLCTQLFLSTTIVSGQQRGQVPKFLDQYSMRDFHIDESKPIGSIVYTLKGEDPKGGRVNYAISTDVFDVDSETGNVKLIKQLDRETKSKIDVIISVSDSNGEVTSLKRSIFVDDADDSSPVFQQNINSTFKFYPGANANYAIKVLESVPVDQIISGDILVTDADEGTNAEILFECRSTKTACQTFEIISRRISSGRYTFNLKTKQSLDFEQAQSYKLTVVAKGRKPDREKEAVIDISVINVQDERPKFVNAPYLITVEENTPAGSVVLQLDVQDGDLMDQRKLGLIIFNDFNNYFTVTKEIESETIWYIETSKNLIDREDPFIVAKGGLYEFNLVAFELDDEGRPIIGPGEKTNTTVVINVMIVDVKDSLPKFTRLDGTTFHEPFISLNISESLSTGSAAAGLDLMVSDDDIDSNAIFSLALIDSDETKASQVFSVEPAIVHGQAPVILRIINSTLLDYEDEQCRRYNFALIAVKDNVNKVMLRVTVNVQDANDNSPYFVTDQFTIQIPESVSANTVIQTITATDRDSDLYGEISYTLSGFEAKKFKLNTRTGEIMIADCGQPQCLDYESESAYSLTYEARDGGGKFATASLIIEVLDTNDHAPVFSEKIYRRELITDNLNQKQNYISPPLVVKAKDNDGPNNGGKGNVRYSINHSNLTGLTVDSITGQVFLSKELDIKKLVPKTSVDRRIAFQAEVIATDNGPQPLSATASIILTVKGDRDGAPRFISEPYRVTVREDQKPDLTIFKVEAIDPDGKDSQLRYSVGNDKNSLVNINPTTGELSIDANADLDYNCFKDKRYNITVYTTDNGKPYPLTAQTTVTLLIEDVNNKPPKFRTNEISSIISAGRTMVNDVVARMEADDTDTNSILRYSIATELTCIRDRGGILFTLDDIVNSTDKYLNEISPNDRIDMQNRITKMFSIDTSTGDIRMSIEPDYTFISLVDLTIRVTDENQYNPSGKEPDQTDVAHCLIYLQNTLDRSPIFTALWGNNGSNYEITIDEETQVGSTILTLVAKDPLTNQPIKNIMKVTESDPMSFFNVETAGLVKIARRVDYEELPFPKQLSLSVRAIGHSDDNEVLTTTMRIVVKVNDLNDNSPKFSSDFYSGNVSESAVFPHNILTVSAEDKDSNSHVFYDVSGHGSELFDIDSAGSIFIRRNVRLDRELESMYLLQVTASDCNISLSSESNQSNCRRSSTFVTIKVLDENDNRPQWVNLNQAGDYEATIAETASLESFVTRVEALDKDEGLNSQVEYEFSHGDSTISRSFKIDPKGFITVAAPLSGFGRQNPYRLSIRAFDHGKISQSSNINLILTISDVAQNDGVPRFVKPKPDEKISVSENVRHNHFVYKVVAQDTDDESGSNGKVLYQFMRPSEVFEIDPFTGIITTANRPNLYLDRESTSNYTLVVIAYDVGVPPKKAYKTLNIQVEDVNDNEPYFERDFDDPPLVLNVEEELEPNSYVGTIQAIDRDISKNAIINYEIIEGNINNVFSLKFDADNELGNNNCEIYTTKRLDREERESYTLTIKASGVIRYSDSIINTLQQHSRGSDPLISKLTGHPRYPSYNSTDLSKMRLTIKLNDINDNKPKFNNPNAKLIVDSSVEIYSQLSQFQATDLDSSDTKIEYTLIDVIYHSDSNLINDPVSSEQYKANQPVSVKRVFEIDRSTGVLRNLVPLRQFVDGYFEVIVKADSGLYKLIRDNTDDTVNMQSVLTQALSRCSRNISEHSYNQQDNSNLMNLNELDNCFVATTRATLFITHQRDTFRFVFNKTKLNEKMDEFREKIQNALETQMIDDAHQRTQSSESLAAARTDKLLLNVFNTEFYEKEDGSLDYATITSCSQLVKFNDNSPQQQTSSELPYDFSGQISTNNGVYQSGQNQIISYSQAMEMFKNLNETSQKTKQHQIFAQYGLLAIERCLPSKTMYKMTRSEVLALIVASLIAVIGLILACVSTRMRKNFEKDINLYQNAKYQYMSHYATLPAHQSRAMQPMLNGNHFAPPYGAYDYE